MLGYTSGMTSKERWSHHRKLKLRYGNELNEELNFAYDWVSKPSFLTGLQTNRRDVLNYCKKSMENPPVDLLNKLIETTDNSNIQFQHLTIEPEIDSSPTCSMCAKKLANSIVELTDFASIKCGCGQKYSHVECADRFIGDNPQCISCKRYFILNNVKNSTLQQTLLKF